MKGTVVFNSLLELTERIKSCVGEDWLRYGVEFVTRNGTRFKVREFKLVGNAEEDPTPDRIECHLDELPSIGPVNRAADTCQGES